MNNIEQDEIVPSEEYIKGFNQGYIIAKFMPQTLNSDISTHANNSNRSQGFAKGIMQCEVEQKMDKNISSLLNKKRGKDLSDKSRDKDSNLDKS